jgi:hypothetical protein
MAGEGGRPCQLCADRVDQQRDISAKRSLIEDRQVQGEVGSHERERNANGREVGIEAEYARGGRCNWMKREHVIVYQVV